MSTAVHPQINAKTGRIVSPAQCAFARNALRNFVHTSTQIAP